MTTARTWVLASSGERSEQAAVGLPVSELLALKMSPSRSCRGHEGAEVRGHDGLEGLDRLGLGGAATSGQQEGRHDDCETTAAGCRPEHQPSLSTLLQRGTFHHSGASPPGWNRARHDDHHPGRRRSDQRRAEQVEADQHDGEVGEVLHEPDQPLGQLHAEQRPGRPGRVHDHQRHGQTDEQEHEVRVQLGEQERVEAVARDVDIAGVRTGAGDDGAEVEHDPGDGVRGPGEDGAGARVSSDAWSLGRRCGAGRARRG